MGLNKHLVENEKDSMRRQRHLRPSTPPPSIITPAHMTTRRTTASYFQPGEVGRCPQIFYMKMPRGRSSQSSQKASQSSSRIEDDEDEVSTSQPGRAPALGTAEEARLAAVVARYLLAAHGRGGPLRRADVRRLLPEALPARAATQVLKAADKLLQDLFGLTVHELANKRDLVLLNLLPAADHVQVLELEQQKRGLLITILALIFMNAEPVGEDLLWPFLKKLGIDCEKTHECFGNVKKLVMQDFTQAHYLQLERVARPTGDVVVFHWGERSHREVRKLDLLQFVCKMWGDNTTPEKWTDQYQRAMADAEGV